jgi:hypothetical protein
LSPILSLAPYLSTSVSVMQAHGSAGSLLTTVHLSIHAERDAAEESADQADNTDRPSPYDRHSHRSLHLWQSMMRLKGQLTKLGLGTRRLMRRDSTVELLAGLGAFGAVS